MDIINEELTEFKKHHKNQKNIWFHILCGFVFMSALFLLLGNYIEQGYLYFIIGYILLLSVFIQSITTIVVIFIGCLIITTYMKMFDKRYWIYIAVIFYFLPELSHILTGEKTVLQLSTMNLQKVITNILFLLPFSILSLSDAK